jgi:uncharacterized protein GlcG (DUF336 family)
MDILTTAKNIAARAEAESLKQNVPVAVTVIDTHGNVVLRPHDGSGGVPLTSDGQVIAGVGVSGGTTEQDIAIVEAAMT